MHEALYYKQQGQVTLCRLCPKQCRITEGLAGFCRVRRNQGGKLYSVNYAQTTAQALDPIEKKPLYHFYPGSTILSLGSWGCNFSCSFCQNWRIAQAQPEYVLLAPKEAAALAERLVSQGNIGIAFTYSEPGVWYEYMLDTAQLVQDAGLSNVLVTNGFINKQPLQELLPHIAAMNIDVKAFTEEYYSKVCAGTLAQVKHTVELAARQCHVEITTLLVPELNDSVEEITNLAKWLAAIDPDIPLHLSRYFPNHNMTAPPTPLSTLAAAVAAARRHLNYVYLGNVGGEGTNTYCPACNSKVIDRLNGCSYLTEPEKSCPRCGLHVPVQGEIRF